MATFVCIHDIFFGGWAWKPVAGLLRRQGHEVLAPTLPGAAERQASQPSIANPGVLIEELVALLYYENLSRTVLVGHGFGALLAGAVAARLPRRVARLVAVGCAVEPGARSYAQAMGSAFTALLYRQLGANGLAAPWSFDLLGIHCEEDRRGLAPRLTPAPFKLFLAEVSGLAENVPVTMVRCGRSRLPTAEPPAEARLLALATGHSPMVTAPRLLADLLVAEAGTVADAGPTHPPQTALGDPAELDALRRRRHACGRHLRIADSTCRDTSS